MKITSIETLPISVPLLDRLKIRAQMGFHSESPFLLLKIHTDEGIIGLGEVSATPRWSGEDQVTAAHFVRAYFEPMAIGEDPTQPERVMRKIGRAVAGNMFTKAGIEMALWDILGKATGQPVYKLLGGAVRDFVTTKWSVSGLAPDKAVRIAEWALEQGFTAMKVKVGIDPKEDVARVKALREFLGPDFRLGVDANGAWRPATAIKMIRAFEPYTPLFAEQPVPPGDVEWLKQVRAAVNVPVLADESVYTPLDAMALARAGAVDALSAYVGKAGGISGARRVAMIAEAAGMACTVGSNLELGVGSAAMIHMALATSGVTAEEFPCDIIGPFYYEHDMLREPLRLGGGRAYAPAGPGLGVELDEEMVARYLVK